MIIDEQNAPILSLHISTICGNVNVEYVSSWWIQFEWICVTLYWHIHGNHSNNMYPLVLYFRTQIMTIFKTMVRNYSAKWWWKFPEIHLKCCVAISYSLSLHICYHSVNLKESMRQTYMAITVTMVMKSNVYYQVRQVHSQCTTRYPQIRSCFCYIHVEGI